MVTVCDLLKKEKELIVEKDKLKRVVSEEKRLRDLDEASIWLSTDFPSLGLTNDKTRNAFVTKEMTKFPNKYLEAENKLSNIDEELTFVRNCVATMRQFNIEEFNDKDGAGSS